MTGPQRHPGRGRTRGGWLVASLVALVLVGAWSPASAQPPVRVGIPPGQERLVGEMMGLGEELPGACRLLGARIVMSEVAARFSCGAPPVELEIALRHVAEDGPALARTDRFRLVARDGAPPPALVTELAARVAAREAAFKWTAIDDPTSDPAAPTGPPAPSSAPPRADTPLSVLAPLGSAHLGPWLVLLALALALATSWRSAARLARADLLTASAALLLALAARGLAGLWGPLRVNGAGPLWVEGALSPLLLQGYGPGYSEVLGPLVALAPGRPDQAIFLANAALGALVAPLAFAAARLAGLPRTPAALAALVVALDPASVLFSASESYFPLLTALLAAAGALLVAAGRRPSLRHAAPLALAAALLLAQAVRVHPAAWPAAALVPLAILPGARAAGHASLPRLALAGGLAALAVVLTSGGVLALVAAEAVASGSVRDTVTPPSTLALAAAAALLGLLGLRFAPGRAAGWLPLAGAAVAACLILRPIFAQSPLWQASFDRIFLLWPLLAALALLPARLTAWRPFAFAAPALTAALLLVVHHAWRPPRTTDHAEYVWLAQQLEALEPGCLVAHVERAGARMLMLPAYRVPGARRELAGVVRLPGDWTPADLARERCVVYVRSSLCSSPEGRPLCDAAEAQLPLTPLARTSLPAVPSRAGLTYDRDPVEVVLSRVRRAP